MIAADSSAWIDHLSGRKTDNVAKVRNALADHRLVLPSPVQFELLSGPDTPIGIYQALLRLPCLEIDGTFWQRAAELRRTLLRRGSRARSIDCLIAQNCIDHNVALIAEDDDFKNFTKAGLILA